MKPSFLWITMIFIILFGSMESDAFEPSKTECLIPAKKGGGMALSCELVAHALKESNLIDQDMFLKFKPGGIGAVAYNYIVGVRNNDPELIVAASSGSALNIATRKFGEYDANAVRWLGALGADYGLIAVRLDAPWNDLNELVSALKNSQKKIIIGGGGSIGSQDWMKAALIAKTSGIDPRSIRYVAFEGGGAALSALFAGYINVFSGDVSEIHHLELSKIKVLAVLSKERLPGKLSGVPTAREQGYDVEWTIWRGFYMGPKVGEDAYNWWVNTFRRLIKTKEFETERNRLGLYPFSLIGRQFDVFVQQSVERQRQIAVDIGLINE